MALSAELTVKLDASALVAQLVGDLGGPIGQLAGITLPVGDAELSGPGQLAGQIDSSAIAGMAAELASRIAPLATSLPDAAGVL